MDLDGTNRKEAILSKSRELGFDSIGITSAEAPQTGEAFEAWLREGSHGTMEYLVRQSSKRRNLDLILPGVRSVICLSVSYHVPEVVSDRGSYCPPATPRGVIARYARFNDYHDVILQNLTTLASFIDQWNPDPIKRRSLGYVDTGPILERDLAQRAGVGFVGKHTNVVSLSHGNWIFLCEILTPVELAPDLPAKNRCGNCSRCVTACPTEAIVEPFKLDPRKCISYLTIEHKGPIPEAMRVLMGDRIFGCDDCLAACPWNRFARDGSMMKAHSRAELHQADLLELLELDEGTFRVRFRGTPIFRTKRRGFLRNVCVALGNVGDPTCLSALEKLLNDPEPLIVEHALWAIDRIRQRHEGIVP